MSSIKPILSICIPTYNHSEYLKKSLQSLVALAEFDSERIEVVVNDNNSTDDTASIVDDFKQHYRNIYYYKNEENINDRNFPTVLYKANGIFRKLCNDDLLYSSKFLKKMLTLIEYYKDERPVMFFLNRWHPSSVAEFDLYTNNSDYFLQSISYYVTWIGALGVWESDCVNLTEEFKFCSTKLWQVSKILNLMKKNKSFLICNYSLVERPYIKNKDYSYGVFNTFYVNFISILSNFIREKTITPETVEKIRKDILFNFFYPFVFNELNNSTEFIFSNDENLSLEIHNAYKNYDYYSLFENKLRNDLAVNRKNTKICRYKIHKLVRFIKNKEFYIYGAGKIAAKYERYLSKIDIKPLGFIVSDITKDKDFSLGNLYSLTDIKALKKTIRILLCVNQKNAAEIKKNLKINRIKANILFISDIESGLSEEKMLSLLIQLYN